MFTNDPPNSKIIFTKFLKESNRNRKVIKIAENCDQVFRKTRGKIEIPRQPETVLEQNWHETSRRASLFEWRGIRSREIVGIRRKSGKRTKKEPNVRKVHGEKKIRGSHLFEKFQTEISRRPETIFDFFCYGS